MTASHHDVRRFSRESAAPRMSGSTPNGTATSNDRPTVSPKNPGGVTPTIVNGHAFERQRAADHVGRAAEVLAARTRG